MGLPLKAAPAGFVRDQLCSTENAQAALLKVAVFVFVGSSLDAETRRLSSNRRLFQRRMASQVSAPVVAHGIQPRLVVVVVAPLCQVSPCKSARDAKTT